MYIEIIKQSDTMTARLSKQLVSAATIQFSTKHQARTAVEAAAHRIYNNLLKQIDEDFKVIDAKPIN